MQQHSFQSRTFHYMPSCSSSVPSDGLENVPVGHPMPSLVHLEEWDANRDLDFAQHLRGSQFLDRAASPWRRDCLFPLGAAPSLAGVLVAGEVGQTAQLCNFPFVRRGLLFCAATCPWQDERWPI